MVAAVLITTVSGCASVPETPQWSATPAKDEFSDVESCRVEPQMSAVLTFARSMMGSYYPFVEKRGDQVRVGVMGQVNSGPPGPVDLRIDNGETWTIDTSETPVDKDIEVAAARSGSTVPEWIRESAAEELAQSSSPFTATTGKRAAKILGYMRVGVVLRYRLVGSFARADSVGHVVLGPSFLAALKACGI